MSENGIGQEYLDENVCLHENVEGSLRVTIHSEPIIHKAHSDYNNLKDWQKYLATQGTELFDLYLEIKCCDCGSTQEHLLDKDDVASIRDVNDGHWWIE